MRADEVVSRVFGKEAAIARVTGQVVLLIVAAAAAAPGAARAGSADSDGWQLSWSDEFDGPVLDDAKWRVEDAFLVKNQELQYYTPEDVYLENGRLVLRSQKRQFWGYDRGSWRWFSYTSGLVETKGRFATTYGRVEVRAKLPATQGMWPAHWMLPVRDVWPPEIDIMELLGDEPSRVYMTHHWGSWPSVQSNGGDYAGPDYSADFHEFALEWMPGRLDWYVDGALRFVSVTGSIPNEPFYVILNTAVGGQWPGNPDATSVFPQYHEIDYVRVYELEGSGTPWKHLLDVTPDSAVADGTVNPGEYVAATNGQNRGLFDAIGDRSVVSIDSSSDGRLNLAFDGYRAWGATGNYGVVIYIDSQAGGYTSTKTLSDTADLSRRCASGRGTSGQRADLYFAPGFAADYAIVLTATQSRIYRLGTSSHVLMQGANLDSATDIQGTADVAYRLNGADATIREFGCRLAHLGVTPGATFDLVATYLHDANTAFRANEFVGVSAGNLWDSANPGASSATIKSGDFLRFSSALARGDANGDGVVDGADVPALMACLAGPGAAPAGADPSVCLRTVDLDADGDVDLADVAALWSGQE